MAEEQAPQEFKMPVAPSLAHMVGAVAVMKQVAEGALKRVQDKAAADAMCCIQIVKSAATGAADKVTQQAQQDIKIMQQAAVQGLGAVEQAAARGVDAAAEKLADVAQPVDGKDQLPGYSMVQVIWEVGAAAVAGVAQAA